MAQELNLDNNPKVWSKYAWMVWFIAALFYCLEFFQRVAPGVIALPLQKSFNISAVDLGVIISFYFYAYAIAQIPVGVLLDKYGARVCLSLAALGVSIGTLLFATTHEIWILILARILVGIGSAFAFVGCLKLANFWFPKHMFPLVVGLTNTLGVLGALFGEEPLSRLVSNVGWQESLVISALVGIIVAALVALFVRNKPKITPDPRHPLCCENSYSIWQTLKMIILKPQSWIIAIYGALMVVPVIAFAELWGVPFLEVARGLNPHTAAFANSLIFVGIAIGGPVNGLLSKLLNRRKALMFFGQIMALIAMSSIVFMPHMSTITLEISLFYFGFFTSSMLLCFVINTDQHPSEVSATVIAFTNMMIMIGGAVFQALVGFIISDSHSLLGHSLSIAKSYDTALTILPIIILLNFILLAFLRDKPSAQ